MRLEALLDKRVSRQLIDHNEKLRGKPGMVKKSACSTLQRLERQEQMRLLEDTVRQTSHSPHMSSMSLMILAIMPSGMYDHRAAR